MHRLRCYVGRCAATTGDLEPRSTTGQLAVVEVAVIRRAVLLPVVGQLHPCHERLETRFLAEWLRVMGVRIARWLEVPSIFE